MTDKSVMFPYCQGQDLEAGLKQVTEQVLQGDTESGITDREIAYAVNREFDRIRDVLMQDRETWERFHGIFWYRKYHCCQAVCERLSGALKEEYTGRMNREFNRAMQTGQLDENLFADADRKRVRAMINRSEGAASMLRSIPITRVLAPFIPESLRRGVLNLMNRAVQLKRKLPG